MMAALKIDNGTASRSSLPPSAAEPVEIRIARSTEEVEALREVWTSWGGHRDSDIDVVLMIIESLPEAIRPHVIALYKGGKPDAILIGRFEKKRLAFKVGYLTVFRSWARCLTFVYGALRGSASAENAELLVQEVCRCLKNNEADLARFEFIRVDSPLYQKAMNLPGLLSRDSHPAVQLHDLMEISGSVETVYQRMSSKSRGELRRKMRKLEVHPAGALRIVCYREPAEIDRMFADVERIAQNTYQRGLGAGFADTPAVRQRLGLAARKGWLRAYVGYLGERPISFWIGMLYGDTFVGEYLGFDAEFRQFAPGMGLMMKGIEGFCTGANGDVVKKLDFGLGHAEYKVALSTENWNEAMVHIFSPTFKGALLRSAWTGSQTMDRWARGVLSSTSFLPRLKRIWRDRLAHKANGPGEKKSALSDNAKTDAG